MKHRTLILAALMTAFTFPVLAADAASPVAPPGPAMQGGPGGPDRPHMRLSPEQREKLKAMTPEQRQAFMKAHREKCMQAVEPTEGCPHPLHPRLTQDERDKLKAMTPAERQKFMEDMRAKHQAERGAGMMGGPSMQGGPGAGPNHPLLTPEQREKVRAMTPEQRQAFFKELREKRLGTAPAAPAAPAAPTVPAAPAK